MSTYPNKVPAATPKRPDFVFGSADRAKVGPRQERRVAFCCGCPRIIPGDSTIWCAACGAMSGGGGNEDFARPVLRPATRPLRLHKPLLRRADAHHTTIELMMRSIRGRAVLSDWQRARFEERTVRKATAPGRSGDRRSDQGRGMLSPWQLERYQARTAA